jgi:hypothetical protein
MMTADIKDLVEQISGELPEDAYKISEQLARLGNEEVVSEMITLLENSNPETRIIASVTLGKINNNQGALDPLLDAIKARENADIAGELMVALEGFDVSEKYVELFRLFLFGGFKVSLLAKGLLDYEEFDFTPRVIKKAEKHWNHFSNNVKQDDAFEVKKAEVEAMLQDLRDFLD